jgi:hypothetical protein
MKPKLANETNEFLPGPNAERSSPAHDQPRKLVGL